MPFDNPYEAPIGDLEILVDARARISAENSCVQRRFEHGDRRCLVAALSLACGSRKFRIPTKQNADLLKCLSRANSRSWRLPISCVTKSLGVIELLAGSA
jgi:hypothetical protein